MPIHENSGRTRISGIFTVKSIYANQEALRLHDREESGVELGEKSPENPEIMEANPTSHTPAHNVTTTVAPFRAWRSS